MGSVRQAGEQVLWCSLWPRGEKRAVKLEVGDGGRRRLVQHCPLANGVSSFPNQCVYIIPPASLPLSHPPSVFFSDFYCPRQPHAFMWLISCKITASYFPAAPHPPRRIPSLMGAKRCKLAEREGLLYTHYCGYLSSLFIIVIIINAPL